VARPAEITTDPERAVAVLRDGGLVAVPTETVYGLAADAASVDAVRRVFEAKGRPADHPLIVHVAGVAELDTWATEVPEQARILADRWWPGPLTLLLRRSGSVLDEVTGGRDTVALRSPDHPLTTEVLRRFAGGVVAPSANRFGRVSPTTATDVVAELGDRVDLVLDGGACSVGVESTIVDLTADRPTVLRRGGVTAEEIADALGCRVELAGGTADPVAPGMLASHYAPDATVVVLDPGASDQEVVAAVADALASTAAVGVLAPSPIEGLPVGATELDPAGAPEDYARVLYARLREADARGLDRLVVVPPPDEGIGAAVLDRLRRAAHRS
jgi:L-threonylcarbamoyladenylate synthase